jgi:2-iminobutanoate/2-iminopropanoate deaminase
MVVMMGGSSRQDKSDVTPTATSPPISRRRLRLAIENLRDHLEAAGASLSSVVKTTVFLTRQSDFAAMNEIYSSYFQQPWPARSTVVAGMVRPELLFEIDAIAARQDA